jgi:hypothetical protein
VAKHSPKVPFVSGDTRDRAVNIDSVKWRQIEKAYGSSIPPNVRADIVRATEVFVFFESFERTAQPLTTIKVILEAHDKAATRFFNELFASPSAVSDACRSPSAKTMAAKARATRRRHSFRLFGSCKNACQPNTGAIPSRRRGLQMPSAKRNR